MSKVVFLGMFGYGHINPTVGLVHELINRGEEVVYYTTAEFKPVIQKMGADFREYPFTTLESGEKIVGLDDSLVNYRMDGMNTPNELYKTIIKDMHIYYQVMENPNWDLKKEIAGINPAYIIHDSYALWGKVLARRLKIPAIASVSTFAYCDKIFDLYPGFVIQKILRLSDPFLKDPQLTRKIIQHISKLVGGVSNIDDYDWIDKTYAVESLNIVYTSKGFQWFGDTFDSRFKFVGPSLNPQIDSGGFPFDMMTGVKLIYISLGTMLSKDSSYSDFYRKCFTAFRDSDKQIILVADKKITDQLGDIPDNFIVKPFVPQTEILKRADLIISHGGMNTVNEALYYNVPLIITPQRWDQFMVAERVAELGAGIYLKEKDFQAQELAAAAEEIFQNESYRYHCQIIGETLRTAGGYHRAVDEIFQFKLENSIK